ncbi:Gfo/Idh/MocA family protein [Gimesia fumaroli]|jgi:predicted dehydrogenase|uniref:Inositol 2-dehydrogenase/D-chiro-inositol 3-dehydrogenase n=1 Tax=Gimesia fumaroli TaxID=2527976 RepID=A0A518I6N1_9PLAN|nr:Gfo/Idh/MocA family oxidoreductase [Gimesia fumaroli]QDV48762.1 Inositol 2-dehydrogenase/D-chiro-inositol 3-dehydrogenase [Gimesia fumaroli]
MSEAPKNVSSRRDFLKNSSKLAAGASVLAGTAIPHVYAADESTIKIALVGCGGRGTGAAANALSTTSGPIKLVAMADVFDHRLNTSYNSLKKQFGDKVDVPDDQKFIGFDGYEKAISCLSPGDIVLLVTPPAFRWVHFGYAIEKGINVFMEKPITVDGPSTRKMLELAKKSEEKNLKVGVGLMCRHCKARQELYDRIQDGQIGDVLELRAYRMAGPTGSAATGPNTTDMSDLMYQISRFHGFLWASGGGFSDFLIHNIDESCWMKNAWPVRADGSGGRHYRGDNVDQNFDSYSVEYTFADGTKMFLRGRTIPGCRQKFASFAHGTKGLAVISTSAHHPAKSRIYKGYNEDKDNLLWAYPQPEPNPYQVEWDDLISAIRNDQPYNEVRRGAEASLVTSMGRMAAHTGQVVTYDEMLNCEQEFAPDVDKLTMDSPAPVLARADGSYPVPLPGILKRREY